MRLILGLINSTIGANHLAGGHDYGIRFDTFTDDQQNLTFLQSTLPPMFTRRRVSQLASTYRRIAAEESWDSLDYWKIAIASEPGEFYPTHDSVHPAIPSIAIIMDFVLEKLWRWETYRSVLPTGYY